MRKWYSLPLLTNNNNTTSWQNRRQRYWIILYTIAKSKSILWVEGCLKTISEVYQMQTLNSFFFSLFKKELRTDSNLKEFHCYKHDFTTWKEIANNIEWRVTLISKSNKLQIRQYVASSLSLLNLRMSSEWRVVNCWR